MAVTNNSVFKVVYVPTMAKYTDIAVKDPGALYFVVSDKKIILDGVAYGVNDSDLSSYMKRSGILPMTGDLNVGFNDVTDVVRISFGDGANLIQNDIGVVDLKNASLSMNQSKIIGLANGTANGDAVNKGQLDSAITTNLTSKLGTANGIATLDNGGKVPAAQLPSYVDDVLEFNNMAAFPDTGETDKIYVDKATNRIYRWSGSVYVQLSDGGAHLALGETSSTAYRGDRGKIAYEHSQLNGAEDNPHNITKAKVGLGNVTNDAQLKASDKVTAVSSMSTDNQIPSAKSVYTYISGVNGTLNTHISNNNNPHNVTKADVGLGSVSNYGIAAKLHAEAGTSNALYMTPLRTKEAIEKLSPQIKWEVIT